MGQVEEIILFRFSLHSSGGKQVNTQMEEEKILLQKKVKQLPGLN